MDKLLRTAIDAAQSAGELIQQAAQDISSLTIEQKSLHDYVSEVDRSSEEIIIKAIKQSYPDHAIKGEEYGEQQGNKNECTWIIDPLDGTTNFLRAIPHYAVSIAVTTQGELSHAVIYDPAKNELYCAIKGQGSSLNGQTIRCRIEESAKGGLFATGVPFSGTPMQNLSAFTDTMRGILYLQTSGIRRLGSAALDLAYVAAGRYDGFWESNLQIWDIAAGVLIVQEAGGLVSDLHGGETYLDNGNILAASTGAYHEMLEICSQAYHD